MITLAKQILRRKYFSLKQKLEVFRAKKGYFKRQRYYKKQDKKIRSIAVIYYIPRTNKEKYENWSDGFTAAVNLLEQDYTVTWINLQDCKPTAKDLNIYDFILVKSCWDWIVDRYVRHLDGLIVRRGIAISCAKPPHSFVAAWFYDILFYENDIYQNSIVEFPNKVRAFGVNTDTFKYVEMEKDIDVLVIGALVPFKRMHLLNNIEGDKKVIIGDTNTEYATELRRILSPKVEILDYVSQDDLAVFINRSKLIFIPFSEKGGGERCVLEVLACKAKIQIAEDNKELQYLATQKVLSHYDYAESLKIGFNSISN